MTNKRKLKCPNAPKKRVRFNEPINIRFTKQLWGKDINENIIIKILKEHIDLTFIDIWRCTKCNIISLSELIIDMLNNKKISSFIYKNKTCYCMPDSISLNLVENLKI